MNTSFIRVSVCVVFEGMQMLVRMKRARDPLMIEGKHMASPNETASRVEVLCDAL